jgi:hypothetical protein
MVWNLATLQAKGQSLSVEDFQSAVQSGVQFVAMMTKGDSVAECAVPPGAPSMIDTTLKGITELGCLSQSCAPQWCVQAGLYFQVACAEHCSDRSDAETAVTAAADAECVCCAGHRCAWIKTSPDC